MLSLQISDRDEIYQRKQAARNDVQNFLSECPAEYADLLQLVDALQFADKPNYAEMAKILEKVGWFWGKGPIFISILFQILDERQIERNGPMDWENDEQENLGQNDGFTNSIQTPTTQQNKWVWTNARWKQQWMRDLLSPTSYFHHCILY